MKGHKELADTASTDTRGSVRATYALEPTEWLKVINEASEELRFFDAALDIHDVPKGTKDMVVPYRKYFIADGDWTDITAENAEVTGTTLDNADGVTLSPSVHRYAVNISNYALETNAINLISFAQKDLTHQLAFKTDEAIASAINLATETVALTAGAQTLYGGNATSTATLADGDTLTPDMIAEAIERLEDDTAYYWAAGTWTASTGTKNPWHMTTPEPFIMYIHPVQATELKKDSQFVNASEYGSNKVVLTGEIGEYLGVKVLTTTQVPKATTWGAGGTTRGHTALMVKAGACAAMAYGWRPRLDVVDYKIKDQQRIIVKQSYDVETIHNDAVVRIRTTDV